MTAKHETDFAGTQSPFSYQAFQTDSDGSFGLTAVPLGEYVLFAVGDLELEYANLEIVQPYLTRGKRVQIESHGVETESVGLIPAVHN